jgi:hypothetical protein
MRYGDLSAADTVCDWGGADAAGWLTVKRLMEEQQITSNATNCRTI